MVVVCVFLLCFVFVVAVVVAGRGEGKLKSDADFPVLQLVTNKEMCHRHLTPVMLSRPATPTANTQPVTCVIQSSIQ